MPTLTLYLGELFEGQLKAVSVVGDAVSGDFLHSIFQNPLVPHVRLHQVLKTCRV